MHNNAMDTNVESSLTNQAWGPYELRANPFAILRLSLGTAAAISTALLIPDIFSLLPTANDSFVLLSRAMGLWGYCYVLWTTGFMCILHLARIFGGRILLDEKGLTLGRFGKPIEWTNIEAITVAERRLFGKLFFVPAFLMTIHYRKPNGKRATKQLASFQYLKREFYSLFYYIAQKGLGVEPWSFDVFLFKNIQNKELRSINDDGRVKRILLTALITFGLFSFLGRKASVNYTFNMGNKEFAAGHYDRAISFYSTASSIEFSFAPAWDRLARSEFRIGDVASAEDHWKESLKWKPDFVEAKLGLSKIYMLEGKLDEAQKMVSSSVRLAPLDEAVYINDAQMDSLIGKNRSAIEKLENFVKQKEGREQALCILARCYMKEGELEHAQNLLDSNPSLLQNPFSRPFCTMVLAELCIERGEYKTAANLLRPLRMLSQHDPDLLIDLSRLDLAAGKFTVSESKLELAEKINKDSPWIALARARVEIAKGAHGNAEFYITRASNWKYSDPCLWGAIADLYKLNGNQKEALVFARKSVYLDPPNVIASSIIDEAIGNYCDVDLAPIIINGTKRSPFKESGGENK